MRVELSGYGFFEDFGNERKIRNRTKVIEVSRICTILFSIGVIALVLKDAGTVTDKKEE